MKKNEITNRRLVSALTVGISAMMALATPITAYANGEGVAPAGTDPTNTGNNTENASEQQAPSEPAVTEAAETQAEVVQEAAAGEEKQPEAGQSEQTLQQSAEVEAVAAANEILNGDNKAVAGEAGNEVTNKEIDNVIQAADAIVNDVKDNDGKVTDPSAVTSLESAKSNAEEAEGDLHAAGVADQDADKQEAAVERHGGDALEDLKEAKTQADNLVKDTQEAQKKADEFIETIQKANTPEEANKAYADLTGYMNQTQTTITAMKEYYNSMVTAYGHALANLEEAERKLETAEKAFDTNIGNAETNTAEAMADIEAAKAKVDNLASAIDQVEEKIEDSENANALAARGGTDWSKSINKIADNRKVMENVVENYILGNDSSIKLVTDDTHKIKWQYIKDYKNGLKSMDQQEFNYAIVTYYYEDEEGKVVEATKYFNWDNIEKKGSDKDWYSGANSEKGDVIVVYEKTQEEIGANAHLVNYYAINNPTVLTNSGVWRDKMKNGMFNVYAYTNSQDNIVYVAQEELDAMYAENKIEKDSKGNYILVDGESKFQMHRVVQNQNNLYHNANCLIVGDDTLVSQYIHVDEDDSKKNVDKAGVISRFGSDKAAELVAASKALNKYIADNTTNTANAKELSAKYLSYETATQRAQQAVDNAKAEAQNLSDAIDTLKDNKKNRTVLAKEALKVDDIATYFGLEVSAEKAAQLNEMTVREAINELNSLLKESNEKVEAAEQTLGKIKQGYEQAKTDLENTLLRLTPAQNTVNIPDVVLESVSQASETVYVAAATYAAPAVNTPAAPGQEAQEAAPVVDQRRAARQATEAAQAEGGAGEVTTIEEEGTALAETIQGEEKAEDKKDTVSIQDEEIAKALLEEEPVKQEQMSFWWLLVIALLGEAGREMYEKHKEKEEAKEKARNNIND